MNIKKKNTHRVISINLKNKQSRKKSNHSYIVETRPMSSVMLGGSPNAISGVDFCETSTINAEGNMNTLESKIGATNKALNELVTKATQETKELENSYQMIVVLKNEDSYKLFDVDYQKKTLELGGTNEQQHGGSPKESNEIKLSAAIGELKKHAKKLKKDEKADEKKKEGIDDQLKKSEAFLKIKENWSNTTSSLAGTTHYVTKEKLEIEKKKLDEKLTGGILGNLKENTLSAIKGLTSSAVNPTAAANAAATAAANMASGKETPKTPEQLKVEKIEEEKECEGKSDDDCQIMSRKNVIDGLKEKAKFLEKKYPSSEVAITDKLEQIIKEIDTKYGKSTLAYFTTAIRKSAFNKYMRRLEATVATRNAVNSAINTAGAASSILGIVANTARATVKAAASSATAALKDKILPIIQQKLGITTDISKILNEKNLKELFEKGSNTLPIANKMIQMINEKKDQLNSENIATIASEIAENPEIQLVQSLPLITGILEALVSKVSSLASPAEASGASEESADNTASVASETAASETEASAAPETEAPAASGNSEVTANTQVSAEPASSDDNVYIFDINKIICPVGQRYLKIIFKRLDSEEDGFVNVINSYGYFKIIGGDFQPFLSEIFHNDHRLIIFETKSGQGGGYQQQIGGGLEFPLPEQKLRQHREKMTGARKVYLGKQQDLSKERRARYLEIQSNNNNEENEDDEDENGGDNENGDGNEQESEEEKPDGDGGDEDGDGGDGKGTDDNEVKDGEKKREPGNNDNQEKGTSKQENGEPKSDSTDSPDSNNSSGDLETRVANLESLVSGLKNQLGVEPSDSTKCVNVTIPDSNGDEGDLENTDAQVKHKNMVRLSRILRLMEDNNTESLYNFIKGSDNNYEWVPTGKGNDNLCNLDLLLQRLIVLSALPLNNKEKMLFSAILKNLDGKDDSSGGDKLSIMLNTFGIENN